MKMKFAVGLAYLMLFACACEREPMSGMESDAEGEVRLDLVLPDVRPGSAVAATSSEDYEWSVNSVQVLVFSKSGGALDKYVDAGNSVEGITMNVSKGEKQVWAVLNGPDLSSVNNLSALKSFGLSLGGDNGTEVSKGMVMAGSADVDVSVSSSSCAVDVSRFVSRITLGGVTNSLPSAYGDLVIKSAMLTNVVGNQNIGGTAPASVWHNRYGRADESPQVSGHIIDGVTYKASIPELTFHSIDRTVANGESMTSPTYCFYTMPNVSAVSPAPFSVQFTPQRTVLVLTAELAGRTYYYPVALDMASLERNKTYSVSLNILGPGSTDPNIPVVKTECTVSISVSDWEQGTDYNVSI